MPGRRVGAYVGTKLKRKMSEPQEEPLLGSGTIVNSVIDGIERRRPQILPKVLDEFKTWTPGERILSKK